MHRRPTRVQPQARGNLRGAGGAVRAEILTLHRAIFRQNQTRINQAVFGYNQTFQRYERDYARGVRRYQRRAPLAELDRELAAADVVYVGDYHTLPQAQRAFLRLLRRLPEDRPVIVALELVQGRFQRALDAFVAGRLSETAFLNKVRHHSDWAFGGWPNFREILALTRRRGWRAIAIDSPGRGPAGASLLARDRYAAARIAAALAVEPSARVCVLIGELHLAPRHLPLEVRRAVDDAQPLRALTLYQNSPAIYWQLEARGREQDTELVRVGPGQYCMLNTPPIVCQQSFLNWLDVDDAIPTLEAPEENFKEYARLIARFFDLPLGTALDEVELTTVADLSFLNRLRRRGDFSATDMRRIRAQILRSESLYIPRAKMVYLGNLSVNHAAEEATHFLRHVVAGAVEPRLLLDAFYHRCLEEALGFFGSKLINHKRKAPDLRRLERGGAAARAERRLGRLLRRHLLLEAGARPRGMGEVYGCDAQTFDGVTHLLGYRLGERLYYGLLAGALTKAQVREIFTAPLADPGDALATYLFLITATADVRVPERM